MKNVLVTGGAGYIGSQMIRLMRNSNFKPVIFDNLTTGHRPSVPQGMTFVKGDLRNKSDVEKVFRKFSFDAVVHFAGTALVQESINFPFKYYENNLAGSIHLVSAMQKFGVKKLVFSSSGTVYGNTNAKFIPETALVQPINPYGRSKAAVERMIQEVAVSDPKFSYIIFRYFNVAGADPYGEIGEVHTPETHLIPIILDIIRRGRGHCVIFGDNYSTKDGTCIRDYIHAEDLCRAHVLALSYLKNKPAREIINLGSGKGYSVKEIIRGIEKETQQKCPTRIGPRRPGDPKRLVAAIQKAKKILNWSPRHNLSKIVKTAWAWEQTKKLKH